MRYLSASFPFHGRHASQFTLVSERETPSEWIGDWRLAMITSFSETLPARTSPPILGKRTSRESYGDDLASYQ